jgi:hypothetical protein
MVRLDKNIEAILLELEITEKVDHPFGGDEYDLVEGDIENLNFGYKMGDSLGEIFKSGKIDYD